MTRVALLLVLTLTACAGEHPVCLSDDAESGVGVDTCRERVDDSSCGSGWTEHADQNLCVDLGFDMLSTDCDTLSESGSSLWIRTADCPAE